MNLQLLMELESQICINIEVLTHFSNNGFQQLQRQTGDGAPTESKHIFLNVKDIDKL